MASLPADVTKYALSFLAVADVPRGAALCKAWSAAARARELWLALCEARWPSTVSGALRQAVLRHGRHELLVDLCTVAHRELRGRGA